MLVSHLIIGRNYLELQKLMVPFRILNAQNNIVAYYATVIQ